MKSQITKIVSLLVCVCLIVSGMILSTSAATSSYVKVTEAPTDWSGEYLIVYEAGANSRVLNGGLSSIDAEGNYITAAVVDNKIEANATTNAAKFTIAKKGNAYTIRSASGRYIGNTSSNSNKLMNDASTQYDNTITLNADKSVNIVSSNTYLRSNIATSNGDRFRYYKASSYTNQKAIALYKLETTGGNQGGDGDDNTGAGGTTPTPTPSTPFDPTNKTPAEIMTAAKALTGSETIANVTLTGTIKSVDYNYSSTNKNLTVTIDVEGTSDSLKCYKLTADDANLETLAGLAEGDKITVNGTIGVYNNAPQFTEGAKMTACVKNPTPPTAEPELEVVTAPVAGTAYKFGMVQGNVNNTIYYLKGGMSGHYMDTTDKGSKAIDVYLEETTGGYYLYTLDGTTKTYINMVVSGTYVNGAYEATASTVYTYDATSKTVIATVTVGTYEPSPYWFGTRNDNTYTTVGPCLTKYNGFYCQFYAEKATDNDDNQGGNTDDNQGGNTNTGAGTNTGANTNTNTNTNTGSTTTTTPAPEKSPETGDSIALYIVMMAISAAAMVLVAKKRFA